MSRRLDPAAVLFAATLVFAGVCGGIDACTPAQSTMWSSIEATVLADVENGSALSVIEAAVVAIDPAAGAIAGLVDQIIVDAIDFLEDTGALPVADGGSYAESVKSQAQATLAATRGRQ